METVNDILDKIAADIQKLIDDCEEEPVYEEDYPYLGGLEEALGIVNRHRHELEKNRRLKKMSEWILFKDKLPEHNQRILTTIKSIRFGDYVVRSGTFTNYTTCTPTVHNDNGDTYQISEKEVIAWMPLPTPFEPQESEE